MAETLLIAPVFSCSQGCSQNSITVPFSSPLAEKRGQYEDALYLFFVGQARFTVDERVFRTNKRGRVASLLVIQKLEGSMAAIARRRPEAARAAAVRFERWTPRVVYGYLPAWPDHIESQLEYEKEIAGITARASTRS